MKVQFYASLKKSNYTQPWLKELIKKMKVIILISTNMKLSLILLCLVWRVVASSDSIVSQVRSRLQQWHKQNPKLYDSNELDFMNKDDKLIKMAYSVKKDLESTAQFASEILRWRSSNQPSQIQPSEFPAELFHLGDQAIVGKDKQGDPVFWFIVKSMYHMRTTCN